MAFAALKYLHRKRHELWGLARKQRATRAARHANKTPAGAMPGFKRPGCVGGGALPRCFPEYGVSVKTDDKRDESCCKQKDESHKTPDSVHVQLLNYDYYCV